MTKISKKSAYPIKKPIKTDYFVGTDSEQLGKTVSFSFDGATKVINELNGKSPIKYIFKTSDNIGLSVLEEGEFLSSSNETNISGITKLYINKFNKDVTNLSVLYDYLLVNNSDFLFKLQGTNPNVYVYFNLTSIENHSDYYVFNVSVYKANVAFTALVHFGEYFFNFELKSVWGSSGSDPLKLDKAGYTGNAENLDDRIVALENATLPDAVLKFGEVVVEGNTATIVANDFQWRLSQIEYLTTPAYSTTIDEATDGFYRSDLIEGDNTGNYHLKKGIEDEFAAPEPEVTDGRIRLALIPIFGATIGEPTILPNYDDKFLKRYKTTYKTSQPIFYTAPSEDDYNVIFNGTTNSLIRIELNGTNGKYIKNGAIYPFKNRGTGIVTVSPMSGIIVNAPNGLILNPNQQCYLIKDDYNEWTFINPSSSQDLTDIQSQITAINVLLASDNVNLDNVQELVDAIENVQTSLATILVNDLTTGGTTKALTAQMGVTLKGLIDASAHWTKTGDNIQTSNIGETLIGGINNFGFGFMLGLGVQGKIASKGGFRGDLSDIAEFQMIIGNSGETSIYSYHGKGIKLVNNGDINLGAVGIANSLFTPISFSPTTGTRIYNVFNINPIINQTGGANGITRGIYINPTLTSAFDFRAIEVTAGKVIFPVITETSVQEYADNAAAIIAGLSIGTHYRTGDLLKIVH